MDSLSEGKTCDDTIMYCCIKCPINKKGNINISVIWNTSRKKHRNKEIAYNLLYTDAIQRKKKMKSDPQGMIRYDLIIMFSTIKNKTTTCKTEIAIRMDIIAKGIDEDELKDFVLI